MGRRRMGSLQGILKGLKGLTDVVEDAEKSNVIQTLVGEVVIVLYLINKWYCHCG